jgi:hypothetical protein
MSSKAMRSPDGKLEHLTSVFICPRLRCIVRSSYNAMIKYDVPNAPRVTHLYVSPICAA